MKYYIYEHTTGQLVGDVDTKRGFPLYKVGDELPEFRAGRTATIVALEIIDSSNQRLEITWQTPEGSN